MHTTRKVLIAVAAAMVLLVSAGVAYATNSSSDANTGREDDGDDAYKGSVSAPDQNDSSLQQVDKVDQASAEQAALEAVPGTVHEADLETSDNGYVVYDIEIAGEDGKNHEVKVDAGNGEILHQDLEDEADESDAGETDDAEGSDDAEDSD
jgi:uncharacterized membrane protein YkoI